MVVFVNVYYEHICTSQRYQRKIPVYVVLFSYGRCGYSISFHNVVPFDLRLIFKVIFFVTSQFYREI